MTRLAILSDIHGNLPALEAVTRDMEQFAPDHVIVAGDMVTPGPFGVQVMEHVLSRNWALIRGNHEFYMLDFNTPRQPDAWKGWQFFPVLYEIFKDTDFYNLIAALPDELTLYYPDAPPVRVIHGLPGDPWNAITRLTPVDEAKMLLEGIEESIVISGHYHISFDRQIGRWHVLNPGSTGMPMDGIRQAGYLILDGNAEGWQARFRRVEFDYASLFAEYERLDLVGKGGMVGYLILQDFTYARTVMSAFGRWKSDLHPEDEVTIPLVDEFLSSDLLWDYITPQYQVNQELLVV